MMPVPSDAEIMAVATKKLAGECATEAGRAYNYFVKCREAAAAAERAVQEACERGDAASMESKLELAAKAVAAFDEAQRALDTSNLKLDIVNEHVAEAGAKLDLERRAIIAADAAIAESLAEFEAAVARAKAEFEADVARAKAEFDAAIAADAAFARSLADREVRDEDLEAVENIACVTAFLRQQYR